MTSSETDLDSYGPAGSSYKNDEVDAVRPMESSSIGVDAVVSSSAVSQARISSASAAESQFVRAQRHGGSRGETIKKKSWICFNMVPMLYSSDEAI